MSIWYVVQVFRKWSSLQVMGIPLDAHAAAPGCVGFMPIFENLEAAQAWRMEHDHSNAAIALVQEADNGSSPVAAVESERPRGE